MVHAGFQSAEGKWMYCDEYPMDGIFLSGSALLGARDSQRLTDALLARQNTETGQFEKGVDYFWSHLVGGKWIWAASSDPLLFVLASMKSGDNEHRCGVNLRHK
jgi:hypothetical protein